MGSANLNITVTEKRILRKAEAADYVGMTAKHFAADCPVQPLELRPGDLRWDKRDLDRWIDGMKDDAGVIGQKAILDRL